MAVSTNNYNTILDENLIRRPEYILSLYYILTYKLQPEWQCAYHESDVGQLTIMNAVADSIKTIDSVDSVLLSYRRTGSLDTIIQKHWQKPRTSVNILTLSQLLLELRQVVINPDVGLSKLLSALPSISQYIFIVRWFMSDLKTRLRTKSVEYILIKAMMSRDVVSQIREKQGCAHKRSSNNCSCYNIEQQVKLAVRGLNICPDYARVFKLPLEISKIYKGPRIGIPVRPMLLKKVTKTDSRLKQILAHHILVQHKFDGMRLQIHFQSGQVYIYSKSGHNITRQFAELCQIINQELNSLPISSCIIEGELVAVDSQGILLPLQVVMNRARFTKVIYKIMIFDLLAVRYRQMNNSNRAVEQEERVIEDRLPDKPLAYRLQLLQDTFKGSRGLLQVSPCLVFGDSKSDQYKQVSQKQLTLSECSRLMQQAKTKGYEGLVLKRADCIYMPGERTYNWIGLKHGYFDSSIADSFDLVVVGMLSGTGNRSGMFGSLLIASLSDDRLDVITKCGQGFTLADIKNIYKSLKQLIQPAPDERLNIKTVAKMQDVVWVTPKLVIEVRAQNITKSPTYDVGLSLRHPVFVKVRPDKRLQDITKTADIIDAYKQQ